jgi:hypothetical protein
VVRSNSRVLRWTSHSGSPVPLSDDDQAGTLTVSETGGDPSYDTGFARFDDITLTGTQAPDVSVSDDWDYPAPPTLADTAVNRTLTAQQFTKASDGSTLTAVFSDPAFAGQGLTFVTIEQTDTPDNMCDCDVPPGGTAGVTAGASTTARRQTSFLWPLTSPWSPLRS